MTFLRGALAGAGHVSQYHLYAWKRIPQAAIVAIADPDLERARRRAEAYGIDTRHAYPSLEELLAAAARLNFVDIAAPPEPHLNLIQTAVAHRLPISCQKPLAGSLAEAQQMINIAAGAGVVLHVHENWRWRQWYRRVRRMIEEGRIGRPLYAQIFSHNPSWLPGADHSGNRLLCWDKGILFEWGIHHLDIFRFLFGEIATVYARMAGVSLQLPGEDRCLLVTSFASNPDLTALLDLSWTSYSARGQHTRHKRLLEAVRIEGEQGTIEFESAPGQGEWIRVTTAAGATRELAYEGNPFDAYRQSYVDAQRHFITRLVEGRMTETVATDNIHTLAATFAAYESAVTNQVVGVAAYEERHR